MDGGVAVLRYLGAVYSLEISSACKLGIFRTPRYWTAMCYGMRRIVTSPHHTISDNWKADVSPYALNRGDAILDG